MKFELRDGAVRLGTWLVFENLSLQVESGEIISILGPSGCGKTTLLRACSGSNIWNRGSVSSTDMCSKINPLCPKSPSCSNNRSFIRI